MASNTDLNDAVVLATTVSSALGLSEESGVNINGTSASTIDVVAAVAGAVIPIVSGSAVKNTVKGIGKTLENVIGKGSKSIKEQAKSLSKVINKNSVEITTIDKKYHCDLRGASHKGVDTPHVQTSQKNTNHKTGETYWNKDRKDVRPMDQQDIRTVKKHLDKK